MENNKTTNTSECVCYRLDYAILSDVGKRRTENQDSYAHTATSKSHLFVVADGMGGARGGATASTIAINVVARKGFNLQGLVDPDSLKKAFELANHLVHAFGTRDEELAGMGTTVVALGINGDEIIIAFVGDSRIYRVRNNEITQLSRDHTLVQELIDSGALAEDEAAHHPISHMLTRSLGPLSSVTVEATLLSEKLEPGDIFLLCCDGLYNLVNDEEIKDILGKYSSAEAAEKLITLANERGGTDNITVEVIKILKEINVVKDVANPTDLILEDYSRNAGDLKINVDFKRIDATLAKLMLEPEVYSDSGMTSGHYVETIDAFEETVNPLAVIEEQPTLLPSREIEEEQPQSKTEDFKEKTHSKAEDKTAEFFSNFRNRKRFKLPRLSIFDEDQNKLLPISHILGFFFVLILGALVVRMIYSATPTTQQNIIVDVKGAQQRLANLGSATSRGGQVAVREQETRKPDEIISPYSTGPAIGLSSEKLEALKTKAVSIDSKNRKESLSKTNSADDTDMIITFNDLPSETALPEEQRKVIAQAINKATQFSIPRATTLTVAQEKNPGTALIEEMRPIYWSDEARRVEKILDEREKENKNEKVDWSEEQLNISLNKQTDSEQEEEISILGPTILTKEEREMVAKRKQILREKIYDIDAKLQVFAFQNLEESQAAQVKLEQEIKETDFALEHKTQESEVAKERISGWEKHLNEVKERGFEGKGFVLELAARSEQVKKHVSDYESTATAYQEALAQWKLQSKDSVLAAKMIATSRDLRISHDRLEQEILRAISAFIEKQKAITVDSLTLISFLEQRRDRLNRQIGFIMAYSPNLSAKRKLVLQKELLDSRRFLEQEYKILNRQLLEKDELQIRRDLILQKIASK